MDFHICLFFTNFEIHPLTIHLIYFQPRFTWDEVHDEAMQCFIMLDLAKKWREYRIGLWKKQKCNIYDDLKINKSKMPTKGVDKRDWDAFCKYKCGKKSIVSDLIGFAKY